MPLFCVLSHAIGCTCVIGRAIARCAPIYLLAFCLFVFYLYIVIVGWVSRRVSSFLVSLCTMLFVSRHLFFYLWIVNEVIVHCIQWVNEVTLIFKWVELFLVVRFSLGWVWGNLPAFLGLDIVHRPPLFSACRMWDNVLMKTKKRGTCSRCGAKKYLQFLAHPLPPCFEDSVRWICKNRKRCDARTLMYKK